MSVLSPFNLWKRLFPAADQNTPNSGRAETSPDTFANLLQTFVNTRTPVEKKAWLKAHPQLVSPRAEELLSHAAKNAANERDRHALEQNRRLLVLCREVGIDAAFTPIPDTPPGTPLGFVLQAFINTRGLEQKRVFLKSHPELLGPEAEEILTRSANEQSRSVLEPFRRLFEVCRQVGVDGAFDEAARQVFNELVRKFETGNSAAEVASEAITLIPDLPKLPRAACMLLAMVSSIRAGNKAGARQLAVRLNREATGWDLPGMPSRSLGPAVLESKDVNPILETLDSMHHGDEGTADERDAIRSLIVQYTERKKQLSPSR